MRQNNANLEVLQGEVAKCLAILERLRSGYERFLVDDLPKLGKKHTSAVVVAEFLTDTYTCCETLFLRISQHFENHLDGQRWHADLLQKMILRIPAVREPALGDTTYALLLELMKFRHFRRYYFELDYDWDKLAYLQKKYDEVLPLLRADLERFAEFLRRLQKRDGARGKQRTAPQTRG